MSDAGPRTLGERFRAAREARGLSLSDVADQIRIRSVYLSAIEDENWNAIGAAGLYSRLPSHYARYLGTRSRGGGRRLQRDAARAACAEAPTSLPDQPARRARRGIVLIWIAGAVAVLLVAFVVYNELTLRSEQGAVAIASATPAAAASESPSPPAPSPTPTLGGGQLARSGSLRPLVAAGYG